MTFVTSTRQVLVVDSFDDMDPSTWRGVRARRQSHSVFTTWEWQRAWWEAFGRGELLIAAGLRDGVATTVVPLFADHGMLFLVGSGGSDYLDFIGDVDDHALLATILTSAMERVPAFVGLRLYHIPDWSPTVEALPEIASRVGLVLVDEGWLNAPALDLADGAGGRAADKQSLRRHERGFVRDGDLRVSHFHDGREILPQLDAFFEQHAGRWHGTAWPSLFMDERQRAFYRRVTELAADADWLRFTRVEWKGEPVAFHFGFSIGGEYLWYKPSFAIHHARRSPGEVLLRHLLLDAEREGAGLFDFGLGEEAFKQRFSSRSRTVRTWGLYPPHVLRRDGVQ